MRPGVRVGKDGLLGAGQNFRYLRVSFGVFSFKEAVNQPSPIHERLPNMSKRKLISAAIASTFACAYVVSYAVHSSQGQYVPNISGLQGPETYEWMPGGFDSRILGQRLMMTLYVPLWLLDTHVWHTPRKVTESAFTSA